MRGRGRLPATLTATGNREMGRANIGQDALTQPQNEFTWTVNNGGDLATGTLALQNNNPAEFEVRNDGCSNAAIAGRSSCQITIRFRPAGTGTRTGRIVVSDSDSARSVALTLTGLGVQLAGLGQSLRQRRVSRGLLLPRRMLQSPLRAHLPGLLPRRAVHRPEQSRELRQRRRSVLRGGQLQAPRGCSLQRQQR
jgi:hypothetical protein